jgi:hypothetical protein
MDQTMVDCGDDPVSVGDEAVLIGSQQGESITATSGPIVWARSRTRWSAGSRPASSGVTPWSDALASSAVMLHLRSDSVAATSAIAASLAGVARRGDLIVLAGEMGTGKTAFAKGFGEAIGVSEPITSPTYTLVHSYPAGRSRCITPTSTA